MVLHSSLLVTRLNNSFVYRVPENKQFKTGGEAVEDTIAYEQSDIRAVEENESKEEEDAPIRSHIAHFLDTAYLVWNPTGKMIPNTKASADVTFVGPALYYFHFRTPLGEIMLFQSNTPVKPVEQEVEFTWYAEPKIPRILVAYVVGTLCSTSTFIPPFNFLSIPISLSGNWIAQWKNDIFVWENKKFLNKPVLIKNDGPIMKLRRWVAQVKLFLVIITASI